VVWSEGKGNLEDPDLGGRKKLGRNFRKLDGGHGMDCSGSG